MRTEAGYTVIHDRRLKRPERLHRIIYELHNGPIPKNICVCHQCDNPACSNPNHLFLGTQAENMSDMKSKGRAALGERNGSSKLNKEKVVEIRSLLKEGRTQKSIANIYGVARETIKDIANARTWSHI